MTGEMMNAPFPDPVLRHVIVELLKVAVHRHLSDSDVYSAFDARAMYDDAMRSMAMEIVAYVTASKKEERYVTKTARVPLRPVRDGALIWLANRRLFSSWDLLYDSWEWICRKIQWRSIETEVIHTTYHGCPHIRLPGTDVQHLQWLDWSE